MALINNLYVFVESESVSYGAEISSHPVEEGVELTDHMKKNAIEMSITGKIVSVSDSMPASTILAQLKNLQSTGSLITYKGRNIMSSMQIADFATSHPNTVWGGCEFSMTLKEVRIAKPAYTPPITNEGVENGGTQKVENGEGNEVYHTVKAGDCVWNLVTKSYKSLKYYENGTVQNYTAIMDKCNWVMRHNQSAFSRPNDFRTLQIGKKLLVGYKG